MRYLSTRGAAPAVGFEEAMLAGLAPDGGLYVPESWPHLPPAKIAKLGEMTYPALAAKVMRPYLGGTVPDDELEALLAVSYVGFRHVAVAPLVQLEPNFWLLELFHGPTLAFKDYALQVVARLFDRALERRGQRATIVAATSGDTGSAAIEACRGREAIDIFVLHPAGRISEVQRRQMTTVIAPNVHNIAITGTFDDCQDLVKAMFADAPFRDRLRLSAVNSINWARLVAQIPYYFAAAVALDAPSRAVSFAVPTGNFGNVYAAYCARRMGLPVDSLVVASNRNDILTRFFEAGTLEARPVVPTLSPSMDIQISSNLERLLFDLLGRDGAAVAAVMRRFRAEGRAAVAEPARRAAGEIFRGFSLDDEGTLHSIASTFERYQELTDPHTAVGLAAAHALPRDPLVPMIALATAHPAKFPEAVQRATGVRPGLPAHLADLMERPERYVTLPNDLGEVKAFIAGCMEKRGAAAPSKRRLRRRKGVA